jgi:hypothetical protein
VDAPRHDDRCHLSYVGQDWRHYRTVRQCTKRRRKELSHSAEAWRLSGPRNMSYFKNI